MNRHGRVLPLGQNSSEVNEKAIRLYWYVLRYYAEHGYAPSVREMVTAMGISSTSVVASYVKVLIQWGWLERTGHGQTRGRNLRPIRATERGLSAEQIGRLYGWEPVALDPAEAMAMAKAAKRRRASKHYKPVREQIKPFGG